MEAEKPRRQVNQDFRRYQRMRRRVSFRCVVKPCSVYCKESVMSDTKGKIKDGIDKAADKAKDVAGKAVDKTKEAAKSTGEAVKKQGEKIKDAGK